MKVIKELYLIPENVDTEMKFVVSDFEKYLDDVDERTLLLSTTVEESFEDLVNYKSSPEEYFVTARVTQQQVNSLIIELTLSDEPPEWTVSYKTYLGALKKLNEQITETVVVANLIKDNNSNSIDELISKSDVISFHCKPPKDDKPMITKEHYKKIH